MSRTLHRIALIAAATALTAACAMPPAAVRITSVPTEGHTIPVASPATFTPTSLIVRNQYGGEIPRSVPVAPVGEDGLGDVSPG